MRAGVIADIRSIFNAPDRKTAELILQATLQNATRQNHSAARKHT